MGTDAGNLVLSVFVGIMMLIVFIWGGYEAYRAILRKRIQSAKKNWPKLFAEIFQKAKKELWIMAAVVNHDVWENKKIIAACKEAVQRGIMIHLACKWFDVRSVEMARLINEGAIKFYPLPHQRTYNHFMVNDSGQFIGFWERNSIPNYIYYFHRDPRGRKPDDFLSDFSRETKDVTPAASGTFPNHLEIAGSKEKERLGTEYYLTDPSLEKTAHPEQVANFMHCLEN